MDYDFNVVFLQSENFPADRKLRKVIIVIPGKFLTKFYENLLLII